MAAATANVGSFNKNSANGVTAYGTTVHFTIPANAGITGCSVSFVTHSSGGTTQDRAFALNGARAHSSGSWAQAGPLDHALLNAGDNTFRVTLKSQAGAACWWNISSIALTITYTEPGGGSVNIGTLAVTASLTAGGDISIAVGAGDAGVFRDITIRNSDMGPIIATVKSAQGSAAANFTFTVPENWCNTYAPDENRFTLVVMLDAYVSGGVVVGRTTKTVDVLVPDDALPAIGDFTATLNSNGVDASITGYVQNYSKADLAITGAAGALGSTIEAYEITGGGWSGDAADETFGPFAQAGDIAFTATVTDSRGRTATDTVTITVLPYAPAAFSNPEAWRSSDTGVKNGKGTYARLKSGVSYSSLNSQNSVTLKGRVYPKGGTVPAYTSMTPDTAWITGGGLLLVTKTYIAQMEVADLIGSRTIEFTIPTKKTGISILAGMLGAAIGKAAETPGILDVLWPIYSEDSRVLTEADCPYAVGDILQTLNTSSPEDRWPGTTWDDIAGRVLVGLDSTQTEFDTAGEEGGAKTHTNTLNNDGYAKVFGIDGDNNLHIDGVTTPQWTSDTNHLTGSWTAGGGLLTQGAGLGGSTGSGSSLQPYKVVYMWLRTA